MQNYVLVPWKQLCPPILWELICAYQSPMINCPSTFQIVPIPLLIHKHTRLVHRIEQTNFYSFGWCQFPHYFELPLSEGSRDKPQPCDRQSAAKLLWCVCPCDQVSPKTSFITCHNAVYKHRVLIVSVPVPQVNAKWRLQCQNSISINSINT